MPDFPIELTPINGSHTLSGYGYSAEDLILDIRLTSGWLFRYYKVGPATAQLFRESEFMDDFYESDIQGKFPSQTFPPEDGIDWTLGTR